MAKRSYRGKPKKSKSANPSNLMAQVQEMQATDGCSTRGPGQRDGLGHGRRRCHHRRHHRTPAVQSIEIQPELVDPEEIEMLQDLLVAAVNAAIEQSQAMAAQKMEGLTGGLGLDDLLGGLGGL